MNLLLEVLARRPDGYHDVETVLVPAAPADLLAAEEGAPGEVALDLSFPGGPADPAVPDGEGNLAVRAARLLLAEAGSRRGVRLRLRKEIPSGAGLGGGSSDAAGALRAVNRLLGDPVGEGRLAELALELGSDVPFFLRGVPSLARGRGERIAAAAAAGGLRFLVLHPGFPCTTGEVYARCRPAGPGERRSPEAVLAALAAGDPAALAAACFNRLEAAAREVRPELGPALDAWRALDAGPVHLSGSGSAAFLVLPPGAGAGTLHRRLLDSAPRGSRIWNFVLSAAPESV